MLTEKILWDLRESEESLVNQEHADLPEVTVFQVKRESLLRFRATKARKEIRVWLDLTDTQDHQDKTEKRVRLENLVSMDFRDQKELAVLLVNQEEVRGELQVPRETKVLKEPLVVQALLDLPESLVSTD